MECAGVDDSRNLVALLDARTRPEPADDDGLVLADADLRLRLQGAGVLRELAGLVGLRLGALDREVGHDLGAERLAQLEPSSQRPPGGVGRERRVFEILGADAEHDGLPS